ncbi:MAG: aminoacyl-tRNA hydrolase [Bacteroidetes bacterium GWF2_38_335]|nr:MAG: aminoacyl-tRNA hydrolase [Bacteroidetes bacterium GWF2_38_335]OFY81074.1 MAG: aminoacyl-tRNA hydrolase [Bacteroidetes bacterium RIFOXYA12_FULL_38_20]HBS87608.1 aminoacyl-tRNA hydrolase [Bacteroidales bacterium]
MKYLIAGLGNIGPEYQNTRHNIGFKILDALAGASNIVFIDKRYGFIAEMKWKARTYILLKPSTYMNRSGLAVNYWLKKENIPVENLLVVNDDIALPFGVIRLRAKGGDAGHNGLGSINEILGTSDYARMRFGIGNDFPSGAQANYVLSNWSAEEEKALPDRITIATDAIKSFGFIGITSTMNAFNNK